MDNIRQAAVAKLFYPGDAHELGKMVDGLLNQVVPRLPTTPKAIIAPHAGYIYSGPIAASIYAELAKSADAIKTVVILGPSHRVGFHGLAVSDAHYYGTPLGLIPVDTEKIQDLLRHKLVTLHNQAHLLEHSLEVHLPFLQKIYAEIHIIPIVVGDATTQEVSRCLEAIWGGAETLVVISSDLSHFHSYEVATQLDKDTCSAIEAYKIDDIHSENACGYIPIRGLLHYAQRLNLNIKTLDYRNSGDTAGTKDQVVGYGAYAFNLQ